MSEKSQIVFMQARLIRLAAKKWNTDIQKASSLLSQYGLLKLIEDGFETFHTDGDHAVFYDLETILESKGVDIVAALGQ